jgi:hypothetical protein
MTRRQALLSLSAAAAASAAPAEPPEVLPAVVEPPATTFARRSPTPPAHGSEAFPTPTSLHNPGSAAGLIETLTASLLYPRSKYFQNNTLVDRIRLAAKFLERSQSVEGNIDLLSTNFNSPPDTGFAVHNAATAAAIAKRYSNDTVVRILQPFLTQAGGGIASGGIHTPNHRWVVSSALAQVNELFPNPRFEQRINQWLAEGIDIDDDGQYIERSTVTYNTVCDSGVYGDGRQA